MQTAKIVAVGRLVLARARSVPQARLYRDGPLPSPCFRSCLRPQSRIPWGWSVLFLGTERVPSGPPIPTFNRRSFLSGPRREIAPLFAAAPSGGAEDDHA